MEPPAPCGVVVATGQYTRSSKRNHGKFDALSQANAPSLSSFSTLFYLFFSPRGCFPHSISLVLVSNSCLAWLIQPEERVHDTTLGVLAWRGCWMSRFQTGQFLSPGDEGDVTGYH